MSSAIGPQSSTANPQATSYLCSKCQYIFDHLAEAIQQVLNEEKDDLGDHHGLLALEASARMGCILCKRFLDSITAIDLEALHIETRWHPYQQSFQGRISLIRSGWEYKLDLEFRLWEIKLWHCDPSRFKGMSVQLRPISQIKSQPLEKSTGSTTSLALARCWLDKCFTDHPNCYFPKPTCGPTRLIELLNVRIRLCYSRHLPTPPNYATLSHCWGTSKIFTLKKHNEKDLRNGIPIEALSKTFQDAISISRRLGFKYLWIDSLCIIQDDQQDWMKESVAMSDVYGQAGLNIAAAGARESSEGFIVDRDVSKAQRQYVQLETGTLYELMIPTLFKQCVTKTPLSERAWAFQERYLAQRTLFFSADQIFWECQTLVACETYPEEEAPEWIFRSQEEDLSRDSTLYEWYKLVYYYSTCRLTYSKDKLFALSGIMRRFQERNPRLFFGHIAGLWLSTIEIDLCWRVEKSGKYLAPMKSSSPQHAPSWSWASSDSRITCLLEEIQQPNLIHLLARVTVLKFDSPNLDRIADAKYAKLQLVCLPLIRCSVLSKIVIASGVEKFEGAFRIFLKDKYCGGVEDSHQFIGRLFLDQDGEMPDQIKEAYFLSLLEYYGNVNDRHRFVRLSGLLLVSSSRGVKRGYFSRIGNFFINLPSSYEEFFKIISDEFPEELADESVYAEILREEQDDSFQYVITLS